MATGTYSQSRSAKASVETPPDVYIDRQLRRTQWQVRMLDIGAALVIWLVAVLASLLVFALIDHWVVALGTVGRWLALLALVGGSLYYFATQVGPLVWRRINSAYAAKVIEDAEPSLKNSLLNFLLLRKNPSGVSDLVVDALRQRAAADLSHAPIDHVVDRTPLIRLGYVLCGVMVVFALYKLVSPKDPFRTVARVLAPWAEIARPSRVRILKVQPGNSDVYRGQVVAISADLEGAREKDTVQLVYSTADGQTVDAVVPMTTAAGLHFTCQLPTGSGESEGIQQDITYRIKAGDAESSEYRLQVLPSPRMEVERVELHFPAYTKRPPQVLEKQGDLRAVEGTRAVIHGKANQEIESAFLEFDPTTPLDGRRRIPTLEMKSEGTTAVGEFVLERLADGTPWHSSYQLRFLSPTGMKNDRPTLHRIEVVADLSPEIEVLSPLERRVDLPVDRSLTVELRGRDPDFGLCRIAVELNKGEETLEPVVLLENSEGQTGPANVRHVVLPQKLGLEPGDDLVLVGVAEDNRRDAEGNKSPNVSRTDRYTIHILPPEAAQRRPGEKSADEQPNGDKNEQRPPMRNQGGRDEKRPDENKSSKNKRDDKPNKDKQNTGDKNNDGEKSKGDDAAEGNDAEKTSSGEKKPGDKQGNKSGNNQKNQPGDKSEGGNEKNEEDSADQKQQNTEGQGGSGDKQQGKSSQQGEDNSSGSEGEEGKSGSQNKNKGSGQSGSQSSGESSDEEGMSESGNEGSTGNKSSSKGSRQGKSGDSSSKPGSEAGEPGENESGSENADGSPDSEAKSGENTKQGRSGGQPTGDDAGQQRPKHDGEAIEEVLKRMQEQGKTGENSSSKQSQSNNAQSGNENSNAGQKPSGSEQPQGSQQNPMSKGAQSGNQKQPGGEQGTAGEQQGGNEKTGSQNDKGQPGAKSEQQGSPMGDAGSQPGEKSNPGEKKPGDGDSPMDSSGDKANDQGKSKGGEKPGSPMNPGGEKPSENQTSENGGQGNQSYPGSGQKPEKPNPAGSSNTPSQDRQKNPQANDDSEKNSDSASPNSANKKQSDSQGGTSGDQSGGGKEGGGQSAKQEGNDAPGSSSSAEDGAGKSSEPGKGETGNKAGRDQKSDRSTGESGNEKGPGSKSKPGEQGTKNNPQGSGKQDGGAGEQSQKATQGDRNNPSKAGASDGAVTGGGLPSDGDVQSTGAPKREVADTEAERLEYAKKSTDMALKYLKDQKNNPDPELLKRLGWSKEDLDAFVRRWESMKSSAKEDTETRQELDDAYRSLGLRPATDKRRSAGAGDDSARSLRDAGARSEPPSGYAEQFRAFRKGAGRK